MSVWRWPTVENEMKMMRYQQMKMMAENEMKMMRYQQMK
jgi:hypothetical protein